MPTVEAPAPPEEPQLTEQQMARKHYNQEARHEGRRFVLCFLIFWGSVLFGLLDLWGLFALGAFFRFIDMVLMAPTFFLTPAYFWKFIHRRIKWAQAKKQPRDAPVVESAPDPAV